MGCIYIGVCSSLVALFLWHQVTNIATVVFHPVALGVYQNVIFFQILCVSV
jgi:ABC-type thiamin/hydroxymethylpyrimidine transport system permease subunit